MIKRNIYANDKLKSYSIPSSLKFEMELNKYNTNKRILQIPDPKKMKIKKRVNNDKLYCEKVEFFLILANLGQYIKITHVKNLIDELNKTNQDLIVIPGGYAPNWLNEDPNQKTTELALKNQCSLGGCILGICAGSYLLTTWGYGLISVDVLDIDNWFRGKTNECNVITGDVILKNNICPGQTITSNYNNGNLYDMDSYKSFGRRDKNYIGSPKILLTQESDIKAKGRKQESIMKGTPASINQQYGKGNALAISCHLEKGSVEAKLFLSYILMQLLKI